MAKQRNNQGSGAVASLIKTMRQQIAAAQCAAAGMGGNRDCHRPARGGHDVAGQSLHGRSVERLNSRGSIRNGCGV